MPRRPRLIVPGHPHHVIVRGVNREPIFYSEQDYRTYLGQLRKALEKYECQLHAFVLMTNHVHLLVTPMNNTGLSKMLQSIGRCYVQYFNFTYNRTGTLWEGRFKSSVVDTERYLLLCYRYIELNPYRAEMVSHPAEYPWSSYRFNALGHANPILSPHWKYEELSFSAQLRQASYRELFNTHIDELDLVEIRNKTNKEWVLGNEYFKDLIFSKLAQQVAPKARGGDRKSCNFKNAQQIDRH